MTLAGNLGHAIFIPTGCTVLAVWAGALAFD
jgi:hypothetical protein